ncbi:MAG: metal ABC transporter ATP-binding protein [Candidatus Alkanophagales archaeon]|nr:MAG: metal ABC transporter ATP-binding protein [Candidatus Alkanophagales archaeon]
MSVAAAAEAEVLKLEEVTVAYGDTVALENVSFSLHRGHFLCVAGPNGAGKTTLLRAILGLLKPRSGGIYVFGERLTRRNVLRMRRRMGYVPQLDAVERDVPVLVEGVVRMGFLPLQRPPRVLRRADVTETLELLHIGELRSKSFSQLSGGQQQRVLIARALVRNPEILLLDEPFSGVDPLSQQIILKTLHSLKKCGTTIILVTHDINPLFRFADHFLFLRRRVVAFGDASTVFDEDTLRRVYGADVRVFTADGEKYAAIGDYHA